MRKLLLVCAVLIATVSVLYFAFGLRLEMRGDGIVPLFRFGSEEDRYERLEDHRGNQPRHIAAPPAELGRELPAGAETWTKFRGPRMDGDYREQPVLTDWPPDGPALLWRQPIGGGYASFVVADGRAFTIEQRRDEETAVAYDVPSGTELWTSSWKAEFRESMGGPGPRATPTWDEGRVYVLGATAVLRVLDSATGATVWETNILDDARAQSIQWGMAASPLILDELVVLQPGGSSGHSIIAYDKLSDEVRWSTLDDVQAYTSPMLVTVAGHRILLTASRERILGLSTEEGQLLWSYPWSVSFGVSASQPLLLGEDHVFFSAGYGHGAAVLHVTENEGTWNVELVWENRFMKNRFSSSVLHEGYIYGLDERILACLDARTGERMWKGGRYGHGQLVLASGHLIVVTEGGELVLVEAAPDAHRELRRVPGIEGKTWNVPVISGGILLVRNASEMAAFDLRPARDN